MSRQEAAHSMFKWLKKRHNGRGIIGKRKN